MSIESGRVVGVEASQLWLETISRSTCGSCSAQKGCGQGVMNRYMSGRRNHLQVNMGKFSAADFQLNDEVDVSVSDKALLSAAFVVYLLPLCSLIAGILIVGQFSNQDLYSVIGAVLGFSAGLLLVRIYSMMVANRPDYQPVVVAIRPNGASSVGIIPSISGTSVSG